MLKLVTSQWYRARLLSLDIYTCVKLVPLTKVVPVKYLVVVKPCVLLSEVMPMVKFIFIVATVQYMCTKREHVPLILTFTEEKLLFIFNLLLSGTTLGFQSKPPF